MSTLKATHLQKAYGKRQIIKDATISIDTEEVVGLLGPNGAGKTTCFYMIVGLVGADAGLVQIDNQDITALPMHRRARMGVGYLPQEASIFRKLTVTDNLMAVLETRTELSAIERAAEAENLLEEFNITHLRDQMGISLSGGERRRVEIARALAMDPKFILLDEPFAGVDPKSVSDIQQIIEHLRQRGIGVLITDHNVRETLGICSRAYILGHGEVIAEGTPETILNDQRVKDVYLGEKFSL